MQSKNPSAGFFFAVSVVTRPRSSLAARSALPRRRNNLSGTGILLVVRSEHRLMGTLVKKQVASLMFFALLTAAVPLRSQNIHGFPRPRRAPRNPPISALVLNAKFVYLDNQTGNSAVGRDALRELAGWGRFHVVGQNEAQLLMVLSTEEFTDDEFPDLGDFDSGDLKLPRKPLNAFLTVIDKATGDRVWIDSRPWGGLLTGENSAGRRLIARFRKHVESKHPAS